MIAVKLPPKVLAKVNQFCVRVHKERTDRDILNNDDHPGRLIDETIGKIGEVGVAIHLGLTHLVDMRILPTGKPNFAPDLGDLHVKTCNINHRNKEYDSWTVALNDPLGLTPDTHEDVILAYAGLNGYAYIYGSILGAMALPHWKPCIKEHMKHKKAIYKTDIDDIVEKIENRQQ